MTISPPPGLSSTARRAPRAIFAALLAAGLLAAPAMAPAPALAANDNRSTPASFADLAEKLLPAVVNISTTQTLKADRTERRRGPELPQFPPGSPFEEFFRDFLERNQRPDAPPRRAQSLGSGFIVDSSGIIVTNNHVIAEADEIKVILSDDTQLTAKLVGKDTKTDLAVLKVEPPHPLPAIKWGDSDKTRVGDWVMAIGNPFGFGGSVTVGIVSARARDINAGPYDDFIQTDASINRGNSGGPMFNLAGEVIGINTAIFSPSGGNVGIGFAISSQLAKPVIDQLRSYGRTRRGWLGVNIQTVTEEIAESLGLDRARGALVARVSENGPAEKAKIQAGDVVLKFDGREVGEMRRLPRMVAETPIDKTVKVLVWRKGKEVTLDVKLGELEENEQVASGKGAKPQPGQQSPATVEALGMSLAAISPELRERFDLPDTAHGVVVTEVSDGSAAAERGVRAGDLIVEVGQEEVATPGDVQNKVKAARTAGRKTVLIMVERQGEQRFVAVRIDSKG